MYGIVLFLTCVFYSTSQAGEIFKVTKSSFESLTEQKKCMLLYVEKEQDVCLNCKSLFHKFLTVAQTFKENDEIFFGRVSDDTLIEVFEVDSFPEIVYYEFGSAVPRRYRGDITSNALTNLVVKAMRGNFGNLDRHFAVQLTVKNIGEILYNAEQYRLVMLHDEEDDDEVKDFESLAKTYDNEKEIVIARINIDREKPLRREFGSVDYPSFYWYPKGSDKKRKRYGGELNIKQMIQFINRETGMQRKAGGELGHKAGLIKPIETLLIKNAKNIYEASNLDPLLQKIKSIAAKLEGEKKELAEYYAHCVEEIVEDRTVDSLGDERNRVQRAMGDEDSGSLRRDMLVKKSNIVNSYIDLVGKHLLSDLQGSGVIQDLGLHEDEDDLDSGEQIYFRDEL